MRGLPVEVFQAILAHLSRSDIRTLRLVCHEFENKASSHYFRNVVVPFRAEIYSAHDVDVVVVDSDSDNGGASLEPHGFANGIRVFQSFGRHILRFALSLELDEDVLASPPPKPMQQAVATFWGVYRWPNHYYRRYQDLERIERTADETSAMSAALRCLSHARNLGLCCDAGLGFLLGPDRVARRALTPGPLFAAEDWRRRRELPAPMPPRPVVAINSQATAAATWLATVARWNATKRNTLVEMVAAAGYTEPDQVAEAVRLLLEAEGTTLAYLDLDRRLTSTTDHDEGAVDETADSAGAAISAPLPGLQHQHSLIPRRLTMAQLEMLVELEWAHRALIQSYIIALMDNTACGHFGCLTALSIAKIPSSHVHMWCRHDLWDSLPQLKTVSLGVIADWRSISVPSTGFIDERHVSPVRAVGHVFTLLNDYIGRRANVESIHFEWICGGELAPSQYQRNMYLLPAPFFEDPALMACTSSPIDHADDLLNLPHVMHLSLKNCWASPHVMLQALRQLALSSLEKLELETVSLSGPPTLVVQPVVHLMDHHRSLNQHTRPYNGTGHDLPQNLPLPAGMGHVHAHVGAPTWAAAFLPPAFFDLPPMPVAAPSAAEHDVMRWSGIIDYLCTGARAGQLLSPDAADLSDDQQLPSVSPDLSAYLPRDTRRRPKGECYQLRSMSFKSCGYAALDLAHIDTCSVLPDSFPIARREPVAGRSELQSCMQLSADKLLGITIPHIPPQDLARLTSRFGMSIGWDGVYDERVRDDAISDGIASPGRGRFSGLVEGDDDFSAP